MQRLSIVLGLLIVSVVVLTVAQGQQPSPGFEQVPVGAMIPFFGNELPDRRFVWADGKTTWPNEPWVPEQLRGDSVPDMSSVLMGGAIDVNDIGMKSNPTVIRIQAKDVSVTNAKVGKPTQQSTKRPLVQWEQADQNPRNRRYGPITDHRNIGDELTVYYGQPNLWRRDQASRTIAGTAKVRMGPDLYWNNGNEGPPVYAGGPAVKLSATPRETFVGSEVTGGVVTIDTAFTLPLPPHYRSRWIIRIR